MENGWHAEAAAVDADYNTNLNSHSFVRSFAYHTTCHTTLTTADGSGDADAKSHIRNINFQALSDLFNPV